MNFRFQTVERTIKQTLLKQKRTFIIQVFHILPHFSTPSIADVNMLEAKGFACVWVLECTFTSVCKWDIEYVMQFTSRQAMERYLNPDRFWFHFVQLLTKGSRNAEVRSRRWRELGHRK